MSTLTAPPPSSVDITESPWPRSETVQAKLKPAVVPDKSNRSGVDNNLLFLISNKDEDGTRIKQYLEEQGVPVKGQLFRVDSATELNRAVEYAMEEQPAQIGNIGIINLKGAEDFSTLLKTQLESILTAYNHRVQKVFLATNEASTKFQTMITNSLDQLQSLLQGVAKSFSWMTLLYSDPAPATTPAPTRKPTLVERLMETTSSRAARATKGTLESILREARRPSATAKPTDLAYQPHSPEHIESFFSFTDKVFGIEPR